MHGLPPGMEGAPLVVMDFHSSLIGLYLPPLPPLSGKMSISVPVHRACSDGAYRDVEGGAKFVVIADQVSAVTSYMAPVFVSVPSASRPPQMIINDPVHTA